MSPEITVLNRPRILVVRHGQDRDSAAEIINGSRRDEPLTPLGRQQAKQIAEILRGCKVTAIYTSPLRRARQTAKPLEEDTGIEAVVHDDLIERDVGDLSGIHEKDVPAYATQHSLPVLETFDGTIIPLGVKGEDDLPTTYENARRVYEEILGLHGPDEMVALFTHRMKGGMIVGVDKGLPWEETVKTVKLEKGSIYDTVRKKFIRFSERELRERRRMNERENEIHYLIEVLGVSRHDPRVIELSRQLDEDYPKFRTLDPYYPLDE